jgi:hypothetical protein
MHHDRPALPRRRFLALAALGAAAATFAPGASTGVGAAGPPPVGPIAPAAIPLAAFARDWLAAAAGGAGGAGGEPLDSARRARLLDTALPLLERHYVFADVAAAMARAVRERQAAGAYEALSDPAEFARTLAADLRAVSRDKHLDLFYRAEPFPPPPGEADLPRLREEARLFSNLLNHGFGRVERLPGNIGYLEQRSFIEPEFARAAAGHAFDYLAETFVLIVDLRRNTGGSAAMVAELASYLFGPDPVLLNRIYWRADDRTTEFSTRTDLPGRRYGANKRVYVLTSNETPSAAEEFAYDLQALGRATIVGEVTWGGANPVAGFPLDPNFIIAIPAGRAINPITGTNWEGVGVRPDWATPASDALRVAHTFALNNVVADFGGDGRAPVRQIVAEARQALAAPGVS